MASTRMKNRVYWAYVKAMTYHAEEPIRFRLRKAYKSLRWRSVLEPALTDNQILALYEDDLLAIEEAHGGAGIKCVHNRDLWEARERLAMSQDGIDVQPIQRHVDM